MKTKEEPTKSWPKTEFLDHLRHLRHHSEELPINLDYVTLILVTNTVIRQACTKSEKYTLLNTCEELYSKSKKNKQEKPRLIACWPGKYQSHVFEVEFDSALVKNFMKG
jgi:hypothetical protein